MTPRSAVNGPTYLVLGILSIILCPLLGPIAWSMSSNALAVLDQYERGGDTGQRGLVTAGRICSMVGTALFALGVLSLLGRGCGQAAHGIG